MRTPALLVLPLVLLSLPSCTVDIQPYKATEVRGARELDILFVVDDSGDRARYDQMAAQVDVLATQLATVDGQLPSLHIGVVTTDLGTDSTRDFPVPPVGTCSGEGKGGVLQTFASSVRGDFLEDLRGPDGARVRNYDSGDLAAELAALTNPAGAPTGATGCEFEQPLEAMRRALDPTTNPGFLRPDALLSIVFLTNEDDCSLSTGALLEPWTQSSTLGPLTSFRCTEQGVICTFPADPRAPGAHAQCRPREGSQYLVDVSEYEAFLAQLKPAREDVVVSAVAGPREPFVVGDIGQPVLNPSCQGAGGPAYPAVRLGALVDRFGGSFVDGCTQDAAYEQLGASIVRAQRSCVAELRAGADEDCTVLETTDGSETVLARCADGLGQTCWYSVADAVSCPDGDHLAIAVRRGPTSAPPGSRIEARCIVK